MTRDETKSGDGEGRRWCAKRIRVLSALWKTSNDGKMTASACPQKLILMGK